MAEAKGLREAADYNGKWDNESCESLIGKAEKLIEVFAAIIAGKGEA
ncbi:MAG: hypothetical protein LLG37_04305 [Spirochaetia bacterium]|nr:hypothetical protein [Spirochaetia bacterium]